MRVLNARFALGLGLFTVIFAVADTAQAGPFRRGGRRAARAGNDCCPQVASAGYGGYSGGYASGGGYGQPMYGQQMYGQQMYAQADGCCPQTGLAYGGGATYYGGVQGGVYGGGAMMMPSPYGIQPAGGFQGYPSGTVPGSGAIPGILPGSGTPSPMPGGTTPDTSAGTTTAAAKEVSVSIEDGSFEPKTLTVDAGTTVKWTNKGQKAHTVTSDKGDWASNELAAGQTFTATFTKPGTFGYHCKLHEDMKGTITVK